MGKIILSTLLIVLCFSASSYAQDSTYTYSPEGCDFMATFPAEPGFKKRCPSDATLPCYDVARYTDRKDLDKTINIEMVCTPISSDSYVSYNEGSMGDIILNMLQGENHSEPPQITYQEEDGGLKIAGASGIKAVGYSSKIYLTQIWVNENSIMTVEGEMSLENDKEGDKKFADILRSIQLKNQPEEISEPSSEPENAS